MEFEKCTIMSGFCRSGHIYYMIYFNNVGVNTQKTEAQNCGLTSITDDLFVPFALPPEANTHSSQEVKLQKEVKSMQKQSSSKKGQAHAKKKTAL